MEEEEPRLTVRERVVLVLGRHPHGLSEAALVKEVKANRGVVRKAVDALENEGTIVVAMIGTVGRPDYMRLHQLVNPETDGRGVE